MSIASNSRTVGRTTVRGGIDCTHSSANTFKSGWETIARRARNAPKERHRTTEPASNGLQVWEAPTQPTAARPRVQGRSPGRFRRGYGVLRGFKGERSKSPPNPLSPAERVSNAKLYLLYRFIFHCKTSYNKFCHDSSCRSKTCSIFPSSSLA